MIKHRDALHAQIKASKAETERHIGTAEQLRAELEQTRNAIAESKRFQALQNLEIKKLKAELVEERANVENEREDALNERYGCMHV